MNKREQFHVLQRLIFLAAITAEPLENNVEVYFDEDEIIIECTVALLSPLFVIPTIQLTTTKDHQIDGRTYVEVYTYLCTAHLSVDAVFMLSHQAAHRTINLPHHPTGTRA